MEKTWFKVIKLSHGAPALTILSPTLFGAQDSVRAATVTLKAPGVT